MTFFAAFEVDFVEVRYSKKLMGESQCTDVPTGRRGGYQNLNMHIILLLVTLGAVTALDPGTTISRRKLLDQAAVAASGLLLPTTSDPCFADSSPGNVIGESVCGRCGRSSDICTTRGNDFVDVIRPRQ